MNFEFVTDLYLAAFCGIAMIGWLARELALDIRSLRARR